MYTFINESTFKDCNTRISFRNLREQCLVHPISLMSKVGFTLKYSCAIYKVMC